MAAYVAGAEVAANGVYNDSGSAGVSFIVPAGASYQVTTNIVSGSAPTINTWTEVPL